MYGSRGGNGVIAVTTKGSDYGLSTPSSIQSRNDFFQVERVYGYTKPFVFRSPDYSGVNKSSSEEDSRSTIYWNPLVKIEQETGKTSLSFYAADRPGRYRIVVEGITSTGEPVRGVHFIDIVQ